MADKKRGTKKSKSAKFASKKATPVAKHFDSGQKNSAIDQATKPNDLLAGAEVAAERKEGAVRSAPRLFASSLRVLVSHWKLFTGILLTFALLNLLLVEGATVDLSNIQATLSDTLADESSDLIIGTTIFAYMLGVYGGATDATSGLYRLVLLAIISLALIWAFREVYANRALKVRDAFYKGMTPLIPFALVGFIIALQLLPFLLAGGLYNAVISENSVTTIEKVSWTGALIVLAIFSFYFICTSLFALYIVTLPGMTPFKALRSARHLIRGRRFMIMRKILFLPLAFLLVGAAVMVPLIMFVGPLVVFTFFVLTMLAVAVTHSYMYALYRELL